MKLITTEVNGGPSSGFLLDNHSEAVLFEQFGYKHSDLTAFIDLGMDQLLKLKALAERDSSIKRIPISELKLLSPIVHPICDIICLGLNYHKHAQEAEAYKKDVFDKGDSAIYFSKHADRISSCCDDIPLNENLVSSLDYEVELAVVIGKTCKNVKAEEVSKYIFGYTVVNDISARDIQSRHKQWFLGKSIDGYLPMGPCIVTSDEIAYPPKLKIKSYVNGELRQDSTTDMMIHPIGEVISELSSYLTLRPGTIIATGTPSGVGMGMNPPQFLKKGDEVVCEIQEIGILRNTVR